MQSVSTDFSKQLDWTVRRGDNATLTLSFVEDSDPFSISDEEFTLTIADKVTGNILLTLTEGDGLTNGGATGVLEVDPDEITMAPDTYLLVLKSVNDDNRILTWINGNFSVNDKLWDGETADDATLNINIGDVTVTIDITLSGGGGGSGSVTTFSSGNLSPLFTTSVANPTSTPALTFALSNQSANTVFAGPSTGSPAAPTFRALVSADFGNLFWPLSGSAVQGGDVSIDASATKYSVTLGSTHSVTNFTVNYEGQITLTNPSATSALLSLSSSQGLLARGSNQIFVLPTAVSLSNGTQLVSLQSDGVHINVGSDADGDTYQRAGGVFSRLPIGTALQQLRVNAGATALEYFTPTFNPFTTTGDLLVSADNAGTPDRLADIATGNVLLTGGVGVVPLYGKVGLTTHVSGQLPLANGGLAVSLSDPAANKLLGWDDTDNTNGYWTLGTGLSYDHSTHTLSATGGTGWATTGNTSLTGATTITITTTNTLKFIADSLGTTITNGAGLWLANTTAAANGAQQQSPYLTLEGQGWKTTATAASQSVKWAMYVVPIQGTSAANHRLSFAYSTNGGAYVEGMCLTNGDSTVNYGLGIGTTNVGNINSTQFATVGLHVSSGGTKFIAIDNVGNGGLLMNDAGQSANSRLWAVQNSSTVLTFASYTDAGSPTTRFSVSRAGALTITGSSTYSDAVNLIFNTTTGTKIGTATGQKIGFWNATPVIQQTTAGAAATFVANTSLIANDTATFDGYTLGQVVRALRTVGVLA